MSSIFFSLNYLSGMAFFLILFCTVRSEDFVRKIILVFGAGAFLALSFGLYQWFFDLTLGNNPISIDKNLINGTFKDALSFGVFLAVAVPVFLGGVFYFRKGAVRVFLAVLIGMSAYMIFFTGSKSGLACLLLSLLVFFAFVVIRTVKSYKAGALPLRKAGVLSFVLLVIVLSGTASFFIFQEHIKQSRTGERIQRIVKRDSLKSMMIDRVGGLWQAAEKMMRDYPVAGVGVGGFIIECPNYAREYDIKYASPQSAENYFLQVGAELGVIGLIIVLWIAWEIVKLWKRGYRKIPEEENKKYLYYGITAGLVSFFFNLQAHTYIGSYEIKYTFWLLVGLLFCLGRIAEKGEEEEGGGCEEASLNEGRENGESMSSEGAGGGIEKEDSGRREEKYVTSEKREKGEGRLNSGRIYKLFGAVLIIFYAGIHLWNSTHSLSLAQRSEELGIKQEFGFYRWEKDNEGRKFRWTRSYGGMEIEIGEEVMEIPLLASHPDIEKRPVKVRIYLVKDFFKEKRLLDEIVLKQSIWQKYEFSLPEEVGEKAILLFKVSRTWNPQKWHGTPDPRNLGIAVGQIRWGSVPASFYRALDFIPPPKRDDVFVGLVSLNI